MGLFGLSANDRRRRFIKAQVLEIAPGFSGDGTGVRFDEADCNWVMIPNYPLPPRWKQLSTSLLVWFGPGYPDTPPTGFYLNAHSCLRDGGNDGHFFSRAYHDAPDLSSQGWYWYCIRVQIQEAGGWRPSSNPLTPDNLGSFLDLVREALTVDE